MAQQDRNPSLAGPPAAAASPHRGHPPPRARNAADARLLHLPAVRLRGARRPPRGRVDAGRLSALGGRGGQGSGRGTADGIPGVLLFGLPASKDATGTLAGDPEAPVQSAVRALKREVPDLIVITDVCLCEYTSHGHCGVLDGEEIANDVTVAHLVQAALSHAVAGADFVAPSDMMDGRVARSGRRSTSAASSGSGSSRTRRSTARRSTARSATRPTPRRSSAIGAATRWIRPTSRRRCARSRSTSPKAPTS